MSARTQQLAKEAADAFSAWINAIQKEQDEKLYRADWAEKYGETVKKVEACKLLSRSQGYLAKLIETGQIKVTVDGQVIVRSLQEFAEKSPEQRRHIRRKQEKAG